MKRKKTGLPTLQGICTLPASNPDFISFHFLRFRFSSDKRHASFGTFLTHLFGPDGGLDFTHMGFVKEYHA